MSIPAQVKLVAEEALVPARNPGGDESPVREIAQSVFRNARGPLRFLRGVRAMWAKKPGVKVIWRPWLAETSQNF